MKTASGDPALHGLAAILLRDSCGCAECRDAGSGQRLGSITDLPADVSVIGVDPHGRIREVRLNHRSMQPLRAGRGRSVERTVAFYSAYRAFAEMVTRPDLMLTFRLDPGDCVVFDNTRILHARTGFAATGQRHLQGCYADLDGVASTLAVLRRAPGETG
jgi:gamma-butyrobetaine dioxygenase